MSHSYIHRIVINLSNLDASLAPTLCDSVDRADFYLHSRRSKEAGTRLELLTDAALQIHTSGLNASCHLVKLDLPSKISVLYNKRINPY